MSAFVQLPVEPYIYALLVVRTYDNNFPGIELYFLHNHRGFDKGSKSNFHNFIWL